MIVGITHDSNGRAIERLSVSTKVAIGLLPNGDRNHPTKLDHLVFLRKKKAGDCVVRGRMDPTHAAQCTSTDNKHARLSDLCASQSSRITPLATPCAPRVRCG